MRCAPWLPPYHAKTALSIQLHQHQGMASLLHVQPVTQLSTRYCSNLSVNIRVLSAQNTMQSCQSGMFEHTPAWLAGTANTDQDWWTHEPLASNNA